MTGSEPSWSDPVVEDLGGGVFRLPLPLPNDGLRAVNVYAICDADRIVLIDGGWAFAGSQAQLESLLHSMDRGLDEVSRILVTHVHRDHYTQAVTIRDRHGCQVSLGQGERANLAKIQTSIAQGGSPGLAEVLLRAGADDLVAGMPPWPKQEQAMWADPDEWVAGGETFTVGARTLRAISTPGHTAGHLVYRDDDRALLFAGDHVLPHITPSIGFEPAVVRWPLRDYLDSLALMHREADARLLPAHGPVTGSVHTRVAELLDHHARRLDDSYAVVREGAGTSYRAASRLPWTRRRRAFESLDWFNQSLAVAETAAHLDVLVLQGRLSVTSTDGVDHYAVT